MAKFTEVPTFVRGEPGFAAKLNQLGAAVREVQAALTAKEEATPALPEPVEAPKATTRRKAPAKAE
jgi:predicted trehalose synthase